ncbi:MAG: amidohydrolase family protein, partial [Proteobacteria bacterium]|nr:amidohydrolase family protein [Pseudomonadota bacterium]
MIEVETLIAGGRILLMDEKDTIIPEGAVAIDGERIIAVGAREEIGSRFCGRNRIEAPHSLIMPGLVNGHTHAAMTCFRGIADDMELMEWLNNYIFPAEARNVNPDLVYWGSLLACAEMIRSGTTTFCDMYIFEEETARAAKEAGMRCLIGEVLFDFPSPNAKTPADGLAYTRGLLEKWADDPLIRVIVEPHALYTCSPPLLMEAKALADEYRVLYATHLLENRAEADQLQEKLGKSAL